MVLFSIKNNIIDLSDADFMLLPVLIFMLISGVDSKELSETIFSSCDFPKLGFSEITLEIGCFSIIELSLFVICLLATFLIIDFSARTELSSFIV